MRPIKFDREELYDHVWSQPVSHLAADWNVKSWHIKKWCKDLEVPMPEQGHWARLQHGWQVERKPLSPLSPDKVVEILPKTSPPETESVDFQAEKGLSFSVPDRLINPDKLVAAAEKSLAANPGDGDMVRTNAGELSIRVSRKNIGRALRIMDTLVKCWKRRCYRIECREWETLIHLREVTQRIILREVQKVRRVKQTAIYGRELEPTGLLAIRMDWWGGREWRDGAKLLEEQILDILNHMELSARQIERERAVKPLIGKELVEIEDMEEPEADDEVDEPMAETQSTPVIYGSLPASLRHLIADAEQWRQLKVVDEYLAALFASRQHTPEFLKWLAWAQAERKKADPIYINPGSGTV